MKIKSILKRLLGFLIITFLLWCLCTVSYIAYTPEPHTFSKVAVEVALVILIIYGLFLLLAAVVSLGVLGVLLLEGDI